MKRSSKPLSAEKMNDLLLRLRKGADATLSIGHLLQVLDRIGGFTVSPCVGVVEGSTGRHHGSEDEAEVRAEYARISAAAHLMQGEDVVWPKEGVRVGVTYYADMEPVESYERAGVTRYMFQYREGVGAEGIEVVSEMGPSQSFLPQWYGSAPRIYPYEILRWLKAETDYFVRVSAVLGLEPHVPAAQRTVENTGSCPCCFGNYKLDHRDEGGKDIATMVLHGYRRPGGGQGAVGECMGRGRVPYEVSADGTRVLRVFIIQKRDGASAHLTRLQEGNVASISLGGETFTRENPRWAAVLRGAIDSAERALAFLENEAKLLSWMIDHWTPLPLPKAGERIRNWKLEAWTEMQKADRSAA